MSSERRIAAASVNEHGGTDLEASLAARFQRRIVLMATIRLRDREAAQDVAQETLRRVLEALRADRVHCLDALPAFVYQTARHVCLKRERKKSREERALRRLAAAPATTGPEPALAGLLDIERRRLVRRAMLRLGDDDRRLLELLFYEELDPTVVAERLGVTNGAFRVRRHRALKRLSDLLQDEGRGR